MSCNVEVDGQGVGLTKMKGVGALESLQSLSFYAQNLEKIEDLDKLTNLKYFNLQHNKKLTSIEGLEKVKSLTSLTFDNNQIVGIDNIKNLDNLQSLNLNDNKITDITIVGNLTNLTSLNLGNNQITDISAISKLTNLKTLNLQNNQIVDILPLASCNQLTSLNLKGNVDIRVGDYTDEEKLKLLEIAKILERKGTITVDKEKLSLFNGYTSLDLSNQNLTDLTLLAGQTELTSLNLSSNQITLQDKESQEILKKMTKLKTLDLQTNSLTDISAINNLTSLTYLALKGTNNKINLQQIEDIISQITLNVTSDQFATITNCTPSKITKITLAHHASITFPSDFNKLKNLQVLSFNGGDAASNLGVLSDMTNLTTLNFRGCNVHEKLPDIDFSELINLKSIYLGGCELWGDDIKNLGGLKNNKNLTVNLENNYIIDANVLLNLDSSCKIILGGNPNLSQESKDKLKEKFGSKVSF